MTAWQILLSVVLGLAINECSELSPWCARKLVRWSARCRYADAARADARAEELCALIDDRPGKIFKLTTALGFAVAAITVSVRRAATRRDAASRERLDGLSVYSGPGTWTEFFSDVTRDQAREDRVLALVGVAFGSLALTYAGTDVPFIFFFRGLGMMRVVPAAAMAATGLIVITWWRRRARNTPGAWIGLLWEVTAGGTKATRPAVLGSVSAAGIAIFFAGVALLARSLPGALSEVPYAALAALGLVMMVWRRKVISEVARSMLPDDACDVSGRSCETQSGAGTEAKDCG